MTPAARRRQTAAHAPGWRAAIVVALVAAVAGLLWLSYQRSSDRPSVEEATAHGGTLAVGATAPEVRLPATYGSTVDLAGLRGKRNVLLYFYEHAG